MGVSSPPSSSNKRSLCFRGRRLDFEDVEEDRLVRVKRFISELKLKFTFALLILQRRNSVTNNFLSSCLISVKIYPFHSRKSNSKAILFLSHLFIIFYILLVYLSSLTCNKKHQTCILHLNYHYIW